MNITWEAETIEIQWPANCESLKQDAYVIVYIVALRYWYESQSVCSNAQAHILACYTATTHWTKIIKW